MNKFCRRKVEEDAAARVFLITTLEPFIHGTIGLLFTNSFAFLKRGNLVRCVLNNFYVIWCRPQAIGIWERARAESAGIQWRTSSGEPVWKGAIYQVNKRR